MTVAEAYAEGKKIVPPNIASHLSSTLISLLIESIAQNTKGSVYTPDVSLLLIAESFFHKDNTQF